MKFNGNNCLVFFSVLLITLIFSKSLFGQNKPRVYVSGGLGATTIRDFDATFSSFQYSVHEENASIQYELKSTPGFLIHGGVGISGDFQAKGILGWDLGLSMRSGGFQLEAVLVEQSGQLTPFYSQQLPEFGKTNKFRYLAAHIPASISYLPFEYVGFKGGVDLYYQFTSSITTDQIPYGKLGQAMGLTSYYAPRYQHPFQLGAHLGVFAPISEKLRLDLDFFTDLSPRLKVMPANPANGNYNFREMGLQFNVRYYLKQ